jgi:hypothetical protein
VLKNLLITAINYITEPINSIITQIYFSLIWKQAEVVFISKTSRPGNYARDYRPINLLSCLGKVAKEGFV